MEFTVCYRSCIDGAWVPFMPFNRRELPHAVRALRQMAHSRALRSQWCLKRGRKVIARVPVPQGA